MKVELTDNIVAVMEECSARQRERERDDEVNGEPYFGICPQCPLRNACFEYFTGDDSTNY